MQGLSTSCVQQRFALIRCCDSKGKKSRRRKTREERRTLVESFIDKYRTLNNGKFPSLNLTHKEVGGSFYIVREIVRDIIQENKVLGPGSPSMKALTLEDCVDEHESENFAINPHYEVFKSSIELAVDEKQIEISSQPHLGEDNEQLVLPDFNEIIVSGQNSQLFSHVIQHRPNHLEQSSSGDNEHDNLINTESKEVNLRKPSSWTHDKTGNNEESGSAVHGDLERNEFHKVKQPEPLYETFSITSPEEELLLNEDVKDICKSLAETVNMSTKKGNYETSTTDALPEEKVFISSLTTSDHLFSNLASSEEEFSSLVSSAMKTDSDELVAPQDVVSIQSLSNVQEESNDELSIPNGTELIENTFSSLDDKVTNSMSQVSQNPIFPPSGILQAEAPPVPKVYDTESSKQKTECASAESLLPTMQEISTIPLKTGHKTEDSSMDRSSSKSANANEEIQSKTNPVWDAIKAFVAGFIEFWSD
ncbi:hypothetical protein MUK42_18782 [Musa troglodytarum]|uniref:AT3G52170-like helix-turn-helix domain-containing protein n=1 Tax=Musa troglodytarum TaxID=320322 RepID=A0A9E7L0F9_9LILI|nr:hypothetical protein MUK42_18782 [Musa troglodytarum]URE33530.1 hypothetical protein MUK42_18782 [Musa troglodytarum]URE33531.1 hypothetical protein MUK42_18782 [Musa troglodytarum]